MPFEILMMIGAFLIGIAFDYSQITNKMADSFKCIKKYSKSIFNLRTLFYQITVIYLLFKIGFVGGSEVIGQAWQELLISGFVVVTAASFWTLFVLFLLNRWSSFNPIAQISIATHFGSVSVGTFIAAMVFLKALGIEVSPTVAIWLVLMELPAVVIGMWKLGIRTNTIVPILKEEWSLAILPVSVLLGMFFGKAIPVEFTSILFGFLFMPILLYFLFEMGCKASDNLGKLKGKIGSVFFIGIAIPVLGGFLGASLGYWLNYDIGSSFVLAVLMASASYVLAPLCMQEILKSIYKPKPGIAKQVVAMSIALSVGVTLPFNILIGFKLYYLIVQGMQSFQVLPVLGLMLPFLLIGVSFLRRPHSKLLDS